MLKTLEMLASLGIQPIPMAGLDNYYVFARDGCAALVERTASGCGRVGTAGLVTDQGFAVLMWRQETPYFQGKGYERPASPEEVARLRQFTSDLERAVKAC